MSGAPREVDRAEPPVRADETATLRGFLSYFRATVRRQVSGLDAAQLATPLPPSTMTLAGIATHLAWVEHFWLAGVLHGTALPSRWDDLDPADPDAEWRAGDGLDATALDALLVTAAAESDALLDAALGDGGLDRLSARERHGEHPSLRWILVHLVEERARHCGHADLVREGVDGSTDL